MDALTALQTRSSSPRLTDPAPEGAVLENIYNSAFRAADHGCLRPWRFLSISGDSRHKLGELFVQAAQADEPGLSPLRMEKLRNKPLRAPLLIVTISSIKEHPKVPEFEQDLSAAAATQNMLNAAHAQGVGAMWRTGDMAYHPVVKTGLGLQAHEKIIGFLFLGTPEGVQRPIRESDLENHLQEW